MPGKDINHHPLTAVRREDIRVSQVSESVTVSCSQIRIICPDVIMLKGRMCGYSLVLFFSGKGQMLRRN